MTLSEELQWRGFVNQTTYADLSALDGAPISFYFGVDPSADSMQIGNFAAAMMVRHFIDHGHKAFLLVGGATGMMATRTAKPMNAILRRSTKLLKTKLVSLRSTARRLLARILRSSITTTGSRILIILIFSAR
jgi:tyrosyl-tRNA synthetase